MTVDPSRLRVGARGNTVVIELGAERVELTPREAQRHAYWLARAYLRAGRLHRTGAGQLVIDNEEIATA